jgi:hypothetical protein|nr:MAG TPA: Protein of unknown function (DUF1570) [Caudoviricetes sp.]
MTAKKNPGGRQEFKKTEDKIVCVLGKTYTIHFDISEENMPEGADGCMDYSIHAIKIAKLKHDRDSVMDLNSYRKKVLRHEIIHAFLYESGMWNCSGSTDCWGMDETITDWIAIQSPKLFKAFDEADCLN